MDTINPRIKLLHVITDLDTGGAEMMLYSLLQRETDAFDYHVLSLTTLGTIGEKIREMGIPVTTLEMRPEKPDPRLFFKLMHLIKNTHPDVIQTWMYHADLLGGLAGWLNRIPVVWGVHNTTLHTLGKSRTRYVMKACALLSYFVPVRIVSCAHKAVEVHRQEGYDSARFVVIPNGFNLEKYVPEQTARAWLRRELNLSENSLIVGHVGRFDPQKDHHTLVKMAGRVLSKNSEVHFVFCGDRVDQQNPILLEWIKNEKLGTAVNLLGRREDIPGILAGLDCLVSSSVAEAFPMVLGEAMACGVPCITTDAGDSRYIVGETGSVTSVEDDAGLAEAVLSLLSLPEADRKQLGMEARQRVFEKFNLDDIREKYQSLYKSLIRI